MCRETNPSQASQFIMGLVVKLNIGLGRSRFVPCRCVERNFNMLIDKCNETLQGAISLIVKPLICATQFEFQSWEAGDTERD